VPSNLLDDHGIPADAQDAEMEAKRRGVIKLFGTLASWFPDSGVAGFGQVVVPSKTGGYNCITDRVRLEALAKTRWHVSPERDAAIDAMREGFDRDRRNQNAGRDDGEAGVPAASTEHSYARGYEDGASFRAAGIEEAKAAAAERAEAAARQKADDARIVAANANRARQEAADDARMRAAQAVRWNAKQRARAEKLAGKYGAANLSAEWQSVLSA